MADATNIDVPEFEAFVYGTIHTRLGPADSADATLAGPPHADPRLLLGLLGPDAKANGIDYQGDPTMLNRIGAQPTPTAPRAELKRAETHERRDAPATDRRRAWWGDGRESDCAL